MRVIGDLAFLLDDEIWQEKAIEAGDGASLCPRWRSEVVLVSSLPRSAFAVHEGAGKLAFVIGMQPHLRRP